MLSSFYPVVAGRVSDSAARYRSLYQVQVGRIAMQELERQLSTGERFAKPSDDPTAALRVIGLQRELEFRAQTTRNLDSAQGYLNATESSLGNVQDLMTEFRGLGIEASGNLSSEADRSGWINQIDAGIQRLVAASNTKYLDRYLFTGGVVQTPTVLQSNSAVVFQGNQLGLQSIADQQDYLTHNVTGDKAFGLLSTAIEGITPLAPNAIPSTRLADLNSGRGVSPGAIQFSSGADNVIVDVANADRLEDVLGAINGKVSLDGRAIHASLVNGQLQIQYDDGSPGTIRISEVGTGRTANDLGIRTTSLSPALPIVSNNLSPRVRGTTSLAQLNNGAGFNWQEGFRIEQAGISYNVDFSGAQTVDDMLNAINRSGASVYADLSDGNGALRIRSTASGVDFSIRESTGTLAQSLGVRTFSGQTRLSELNYGRGVSFGETSDLRLTRHDGTSFNVSLKEAVTVQDILDRINNHADNQDPVNRISAALQQSANGIQLTSTPPVGPPDPVPIKIEASGGSSAAWDLGLIKLGETQSTASLSGANYQIAGSDPNPQEVRGMFNSLFRLREAIRNQDQNGIGRAVTLIDQDLSRLSLTRGSLGVEQQRIDSLKVNQELTTINLRADQSRLFEADFPSIISELNARQIAYEASLKLLGNANQTSLFNYI
ncbi:MAG: flagellin [Pirellula sp.]|jgi:flagellar hook-associated protein 3 FlgL